MATATAAGRTLPVTVVLLLLLPLAAILSNRTGATAGPLKTMSAKLTNKAPATPASLVHEKWAVIVGIEHYQDPAKPTMRLAERSASELAKILGDPNIGRFAQDHIVMLRGSRATRTSIEDTVARTWLLKKALPHDLVLLYFCSRVVPSKDGKDLYLCAYDTLASEAELSGIPLKQLLSDLKHRIQSKFLFCVLDAAAAVPVASTAQEGVAGRRPSRLEALSQASGVSLLSANSPGGQSCQSSEPDGSCFSHYLLEALKGAMGMMPLQAVSQYVVKHVDEQCSAMAKPEDKPVLAVAADGLDVLTLAAGMPVKSSNPPRKLVIGHPVDSLMLTRPDLTGARTEAAPAASSAQEAEEDDEGQTATNVDFGSYMTKMKRDIEQKWQPPKGYENRQIVTAFTIARDGLILNPEIVETSGNESADRAALDALKAASPLAPLPLGAPKSVQIRYKFEWRVSRNVNIQRDASGP